MPGVILVCFVAGPDIFKQGVIRQNVTVPDAILGCPVTGPDVIIQGVFRLRVTAP